ncbi:MAG: hypothetical protein M1524_01670 [Patescibacteria group bacterium]|nr:hypothetical protein [Patescibacteria group bacterium]
MAEENYNPDKPKLAFSKIVATPTLTSWSQAYNAGGLFAVLSLSKEEVGEDESLASVGKDILNTLETEFFTLEVKDLESIKKAVSLAFEKIPNDANSCFIVSCITQNIMYCFLAGNGKILIKRGEKTGTVLDSSDKQLKSASGFLEDNDIVILATEKFVETITKEKLISEIDSFSPSEIAENLSPKIHEKQEGEASAVVISYKIEDHMPEKKEEILEEEIPHEEPRSKFSSPSFLNSIKANYTKLNFGHSKKVFLSIAVIIAIILIGSVYLAIKNREDQKTKTVFNEIYPSAQKKYDEGQSLLSLNKNLARDDFLSAQKTLNDNKNQFKPDSEEGRKIAELLTKIESAISEVSEVNTVEAKEVDKASSKLLSFETKKEDSKLFAQNSKNIYYVNSGGVTSVDKENEKENLIIKTDWEKEAGIDVYLGNVYVLDKNADKIFKFVPSGSSYSKTDYLSETADLSSATAITVDGALYVILQDGNILKFLRGKAENFKITGLDQPFSNPNRIYTNVDFDNIYILDNVNERIVVLKKDGSYVAQYKSRVLKDAKDFEVLEKDKKILVLSGGKIYEITIN